MRDRDFTPENLGVPEKKWMCAVLIEVGDRLRTEGEAESEIETERNESSEEE
jgi:hypothetical protein